MPRTARKRGRASQSIMDTARQLNMRKAKDPSTFPELAERLGVNLRKAYYLAQIARQFEGLPVSDEQVDRIGWTKLQLIAEHVTRGNVRELLAKAEAHPVHELKDIIEGRTPTGTRRAVLLYLSDEEFDLFAKIVEAHGGRRAGRILQGKESALMDALRKL